MRSSIVHKTIIIRRFAYWLPVVEDASVTDPGSMRGACIEGCGAHRALPTRGLVGFMLWATVCVPPACSILTTAHCLTDSLTRQHKMMVFSASHSARFHEHRRSNSEDNLNHQRSLRDHWVQRGVSAHGEIWSANFEQRLEEQGFSLRLNAWNGEQAVEGVTQDMESEDEGLGASEHASTSSHASQSTRPAVAPTAVPLPPPSSSPSSSSRMANKTPFWISAWCVTPIRLVAVVSEHSAGSLSLFLSSSGMLRTVS